jgi:uncharacterized protein YndB with AHSA1/START domain
MTEIKHRVEVAAPKERIFQALSTREGLEWWTPTIEGDASAGGTLAFFFGRPEASAVMEVAAAAPDRVAWRCVGGPEEWVGTSLTFDLKSSEKGTTLLFTHAGWREPTEFTAHCSTKWAYHLLGLKAAMEGGSATPYPQGQTI